MGIHGLNRAIKDVNGYDKKSLYDLPKGIYGVDVSVYLHPSKFNATQKGRGSHIRSFLDMIIRWRRAGHRLLMVFDGEATEQKSHALNQRQQARDHKQNRINELTEEILGSLKPELAAKLLDAEDVKKTARKILETVHGDDAARLELEKHLRNMIEINQSDFEELETLFKLTDTPYLKAKGEADHLLAHLYKSKRIIGVISEDSDMMTHGVGLLVRGLIDASCRREGVVRVYELSKILKTFVLTYSEFVDVCILSGCDYCEKLPGVACKTAIKLLRRHGSIENVIEALIQTGKLSEEARDFAATAQGVRQIFSNHDQEAGNHCSYSEQIEVKTELLASWLNDTTNYTQQTMNSKIMELQELSHIVLPELPAVRKKIKVKRRTQ